MRRQVGLGVPLILVSGYYVLLIGGGWLLAAAFPSLEGFLPVGAIANVIGVDDARSFEEVLYSARAQALRNIGNLAAGITGGVLLAVPVSWAYLLTHDRDDIEEAFVQTILLLPVVVAGIAIIVQHSIALAFSLAGIVAAVRFRVALGRPSHALYIFVAIVIGLGAGVGALEVSVVTSLMFVYASLVMWKLDYGDRLDGPLVSRFVGRDDDA